MYRNIVICAGGSGGHVFPALSVYQSVSENEYTNVAFITDTRGSFFINKMSPKIKKNVLPTIKASIKYIPAIFKSVYESARIFLEQKPDILICFGGIPTIIPAIIAKILGIKIFIHEQNVVIGKANRFLAKYISPNKIMLSFDNTIMIPKKSICNCVYTGYPLLNYNTKNYDKNFNRDELTILIIAGSQGSYIFDKILPNIIIKAVSTTSNKRFHIIQQTKIENIKSISDLYTENNIKNTISDFFNNTNELMQSSDLMIARGGAGTIFEIIEHKIPSVIIPLKNSADNHQTLNAEYFHDLIQVIQEKDVDILQMELISIFNKTHILSEKYKKLQNMKLENALSRISELVNEELKYVSK